MCVDVRKHFETENIACINVFVNGLMNVYYIQVLTVKSIKTSVKKILENALVIFCQDIK